MEYQRSSGILLHPTSLPGNYGIGSLGKHAFEFVDYLEKAGQKLWQVLPMGHTGYGDSPYQCFSIFAGNPILIDLDVLKEQGLLEKSDLKTPFRFPDDKVDYGAVINFKRQLLKKAYERFMDTTKRHEEYETFKKGNDARHLLVGWANLPTLCWQASVLAPELVRPSSLRSGFPDTPANPEGCS